MSKFILVGQPHEHGKLQRREPRVRLRRRHRHQVEVGALVHVEVGVHRIFGDDGCQDRLVGIDEVAGVHLTTADASAEGGRDLRESQVELGPIAGRLHRSDRGDGLVAVGNGLFIFLFLDAPRRHQLPVALGLLGLKSALRFGLLEVGLGHLQVGLVSARVDLEQQLSRLNDVAFLEGSLVHVAGGARPNVHGLQRVHAAGKVLVVRHFVGDRRGGDDLDDLIALRPRRAMAADAQHHRRQGSADSECDTPSPRWGARITHRRSPETRCGCCRPFRGSIAVGRSSRGIKVGIARAAQIILRTDQSVLFHYRGRQNFVNRKNPPKKNMGACGLG